MTLFQWGRSRPASRTRQQAALDSRRLFRPSLEALEERTLLNGHPVGILLPVHFPTGTSTTTDTVTQLEVITPRTIEAGIPGKVTVIALDASNHKVSGYDGTIHFTSNDGSAVLPADYTFSTNDHGKAFFPVTFATVGNETVTAADTTTASITGSGTTIVTPAPVATHFLIEVPRKITAGQAASITVIAEDASNHPVPNYTGTVTLSTGKSADILPAATAFTASDHGKLVLSVTFAAAGTETLTATDSSTPPLTSNVSVTAAAPGVVTHFRVSAFPLEMGAKAFNVTVVALDANNQPVPNYTGTVHFTSSDSSATLPSDYQFQSSDDGKHVFSVTLATTGKDTVTVTDTDTGTTTTITGSTKVYVVSIAVDPPVPVTPTPITPTPITPTPITPTNPTPPILTLGGFTLPDINTALSGLSQLLSGLGSIGFGSTIKH